MGKEVPFKKGFATQKRVRCPSCGAVQAVAVEVTGAVRCAGQPRREGGGTPKPPCDRVFRVTRAR
jgi:hypothetical protein